jgi:predicted amidohydrolase YtcJ
MVLPGFVSGHDHLLASTWVAAGVDLYDAKSKKEYHQLIREYAKANPDEEFVLGNGL